MNKKGYLDMFKIFKIMFFIAVFLSGIILIIQMTLPIKLIKTTENGAHTGVVTALETNGIIWKTDTVYFKTDAESTQEDVYCVIDKNLRQELINKQKSKEVITIRYEDYYIIGYSLCAVHPIITGVNND